MLVASGVNLVNLSVGVEVMNALLLPIVLGFLYAGAEGAARPLSVEGRLRRAGRCDRVVTAGFGVYAGLSGAV